MKNTLLFVLIALFISNASFSAITGTFTVCPSGTCTLSGATTGTGGVWSSSNPSIANVYFIDSVSAIVDGYIAGSTTISYTVGTTTSTAIVTVNPAAFVDSILGPNAVCVGNTITLSNTVPGGTWTALDAYHSSVSSVGVVTGLTAGSTVIQYTAGGVCPGTKSHFLHVTTGTVSGSLYGAFGISPGGTSTLSAMISGGTWSSANPTVATISSTGVVTGVSPGTANISYTVSGCTGIASSTVVVTVNPLSEGISGNVMFTTPYYGGVKVWLIKYNPSTLTLQAVDSTLISGAGLGAYYQFTGVSTDSFRVKAAQLSPVPGVTYFPTYFNSNYYWHSATVIFHTSGTVDLNKDINLVYGYPTTGPGFIGGSVLTGANKGTSTGVPVVGLAMVLRNSTTGDVVQFTRTDASGVYIFNNLPVGIYDVFPDSVNYITTPYAEISISSTSTGITNGNFIQGTLSKTIKPQLPNSIQAEINDVRAIQAYPNPANQKLCIIPGEETTTVTISDVTGRMLYHEIIDINNKTLIKEIDASSFSAGVYLLQAKSRTVNHTVKIAIVH